MTEKDLGRVVVTDGINREIKTHHDFHIFVSECLISRYLNEDWGEMCQEDKEMNDSAVKYGQNRIFASYTIPKEIAEK